MIILYNIIQLVLLPVALVLTPVYLFFRKEKRKLIPARLGFGCNLPSRKGNEKIIWVHALSVGETISSLPLLKGLKEQYPTATVILSSTTLNGQLIARQKAQSLVDHIIPFPFDIAPVVTYFIKRVNPDLFIMVETDFWPNVIHQMSKRNIPIVLVNGRISAKSQKNYLKFSPLFTQLFQKFSEFCMQTAADKAFLSHFSIPPERIHSLGNLKYAETLGADLSVTKSKLNSALSNGITFLCGSTHENEESVILKTYQQLHREFPELRLIIAPRDISRVDHVAQISSELKIDTIRFSGNSEWRDEVLLIDTIGDLANLYSEVDIAFIGGSMIPFGGHNPLEAVRFGKPVIFGPHTFNFQEICDELVAHKGSLRVTEQSLHNTLHHLLSDQNSRQELGRNGLKSLQPHRDVLKNHLEIISRYL